MLIGLIFFSKVVCVDEATANVDLDTDALVQNVLLSELQDRTVISIAHRTETVMNCDRVFVMSNGKVVEAGNPRDLMKDGDSAFFRHVSRNS